MTLLLPVGAVYGGLFATPIDNASFETPDLATYGSYTTGWAVEVNGIIQDETSASMPVTPYGDQWGGMNGLGAIYQQVGTWNANSNYSVTLLAGDRSNKTWAGLVVELWAGGTALGEGVDAYTLTGSTLASRGATLISSQSIADPSAGGGTQSGTGNWIQEQSFSFNTGNSFTLGVPLWLRIAATGGSTTPQGFVDNVSIQPDFPQPPAPSSTNPPTQKLSLDAVGDLFLHLTNLTSGAMSVVQESSDLSGNNWSNRFALSNMTATALLVPSHKPQSYYRVKAEANPPVVQPNVVLILAEDSSKHWYQPFDATYGTATPNIQSLANSGLIFDNAFCNVAVCSAARSTIISGCIPSRIGTSWHRRTTPVQLSNGLLPFPAYLRKAGYYTTSSTKSDENISYSGVWDDAAAAEFGWRNRPSTNMPFYHVRTVYTSHESSIQTLAQISSPTTSTNSVHLYPVHPDTAIFRNTYATYMDKIHSVDSDVGRIVSALQADGLLDNTFIFFIGDNGGVVAGSKGYIVNTGLHVPLVVRIPTNWLHLVPAGAGTRVSGFVSFQDIGATVMNLLGLGVPKEMDGKPFLGPDVTLAEINARDETFGATDRFDEMYNCIRSVQKGDFKYIRHYEPFYPYGLFNNYRYIMEAQKEWKQMYDNAQLNAVQRQFFERRQGEELYNLSTDPFETNNLAGNPAHAATLGQLRTNLHERVTGMPDVGMVKESVFIREGGPADPDNFGKNNQARIQRYVGIADLMLDSYAKAAAALQTHLASTDPLDRYWAMTVCAAFGTNASAMQSTVTNLIATETNALVLSRAAVFLGELGLGTTTVEGALSKAVDRCVDKTDSLLVLNDAVHLQDTLGYSFTTITSGDVVGSSTWLTNRISHLGW
jgi:arylsulfatase A-like enzyme